jgi:hypothetical protein
MKTEKNLAKVFAMALRSAVKDLRENVWTSAPWAPIDNSLGSIESVAEELERFAARVDSVADIVPHVEPCDYYHELERISELLTEIEPNTTHSTVSDHLEDFLKRHAIARAAR